MIAAPRVASHSVLPPKPVLPQKPRDRVVRIHYTNYRGVTDVRHIKICENTPLIYSSNKWHPKPQWLLNAYDLDKQTSRIFAMEGIHKWEHL